MSLSRAEVEAMDRDELVDTLVDMGATVDNLEAIVHTSIDKRRELGERVDDLADRVEDLETENERLREELAEAEATTKAAFRAAKQGQDADKTQTQVAHDHTRNLLVTRALNGATGTDRPVTVAQVREKAKPEYNLNWQTVRNAWDNLLDDWPQFYETVKDGDQAISVRTSDVTLPLVKLVQADLERDDLTNRFVGENGGGDA